MKFPDRKTATLIAMGGVLLGILVAVVGAVLEQQTICTAGTVVMGVALVYRLAANVSARRTETAAQEETPLPEAPDAEEEHEDSAE